MYKNIVIYFKFDPFRKDKYKKANYCGKLSSYWEKQYTDMFKKW